MSDLPKCYTVLFNAVTDAIDALEQQNYGLAKDFLITGQQEAENAYLDDDENSSNNETDE